MKHKKDEEVTPFHKVTVWIFLGAGGWLAIIAAALLLRRCN